MKFRRADPNHHYQSLRLVSGNQRWEMGMSRYQYGVRMRMGPSGKPPAIFDFCMGFRAEVYPAILMAILKRLEPLHESATPDEVDAVFPWRGSRADLSTHLRDLLLKSENCNP